MPSFPFSDLAIKYGPWSLSKADVARQCGLRFHYKYVEKIKEPEPDRSEGRIGKAAHKSIELMLNGENPKRAFTVAAVDNKLTINEIDELATFHGTISDFLRRIETFKQKNAAEKQFVEHQFGLTVDLEPTGFFSKNVFFRGVWDLGLYLARGDLIVVDHKSGKTSDTVDRYENQLNSYAIAGKVLLPGLRGVQSALHYMRDGSVVWGTYIKAKEIDERLIDWFVKYLNESVENLSKEAKPGWYCGFCGYAPQCQAYQASR